MISVPVNTLPRRGERAGDTQHSGVPNTPLRGLCSLRSPRRPTHEKGVVPTKASVRPEAATEPSSKRWGRDSNSRTGLARYRFSRPARSTALPPHQRRECKSAGRPWALAETQEQEIRGENQPSASVARDATHPRARPKSCNPLPPPASEASVRAHAPHRAPNSSFLFPRSSFLVPDPQSILLTNPAPQPSLRATPCCRRRA